MKIADFLKRAHFWWALVAMAALNPGAAWALCLDGRHPDVQAGLKASDSVVTAVVESLRNESDPDDPQGVARTIYTVRVLHVFHGRPYRSLDITSENTSSRFPMHVGAAYLLFVEWDGEGFFVDSCGRSGPLGERKAEIEELGGSAVK